MYERQRELSGSKIMRILRPGRNRGPIIERILSAAETLLCFLAAVFIYGLIAYSINVHAANTRFGDRTTLYIGDSLVQIWPLPDKAKNGGEGGDDTAKIIWRYRQDYVYPWQRAVILMGVNDFHAGQSNEYIEARFTELVWAMQMDHVDQIVICALLPSGPNMQNAAPVSRAKELNAWLKSFVASHRADGQNIFFADTFTPLYDETTGFAKEGLLIDGQHPKPETYQLLDRAVEKALDLK